MATLTIRKLDDSIKQSLRIKAAHHGVSMEEEARRILQQVLIRETGPAQLGTTIHQYFAQIENGDDPVLPARSIPRPAPDFTGEQGE